MVRAVFIRESGQYRGFTVSGHAMPPGCDSEYDLVCAAVSSAVYLTCNTLTDFLKGCTAQESDNKITLKVDTDSESIQAVLRGFHHHLCEMAQEYPGQHPAGDVLYVSEMQDAAS